MKKLFFSFIALLFTISIFAHPPKSVKLTYYKTDKKVVIEAIHKVKNVETHYIDKIVVYVNDVEKETINLTKQTSLEAEKYTYMLGNDIKEGDKIKFLVNCNKMGKKTAELTIK